MNDSKIIELYWNRRESAITESNLKYGSYCHSIAFSILQKNTDAEECVTDTWLNAWNSIPPNRPQKLKCFFAKITRNLAIDRWRKTSAEKRGGTETDLLLDELSECITYGDTAEDEYFAKELGTSINNFLGLQKSREANIFVLRYFYAKTVAEIAKSQHLTETNVAVILSRTRQKLRDHLIKEGYEL